MGKPRFRHVVLLRFRADASEEAKQALRNGLGALPDQIPELRSYRFGDDAGVAEGNFDFAIVADVDDEAAWRTYAAHPAHQAAIAQFIRPILEQRVAVQYRLD